MAVSVSVLASLTATAAIASPGPVKVIYSEIPGHPTAAIPGVLDAGGGATTSDFKQISDVNMSPNGQHWVIRGRTLLGSDLENIMLVGSGMSGTAFAQEGQPIQGGVSGENYDFFDGTAGVRNDGSFAFGARARDGDTSVKEKVITVNGGTHTVVITESMPAFGLQDDPGNPTGDEVFGNSLNSIHYLDDGTVGFVAVTLNNIHSFYRPAIFYGQDAFAQSHVTTLTDLLGNVEVWDSFDSDDFSTTPDGAHWHAQGDTEASTSNDDILMVDGEVVIQENTLIPGSSVTAVDVFHTDMAANGDWCARGDDPSSNDWAVRNNVVVAVTGDAITSVSAETWGDSFGAFTGNTVGDWVLAGNISNALDIDSDQVAVLNGRWEVLREGDPIDLDGNGLFDDDVFIGRGGSTSSFFQPDDLVLTDDGTLYALVSLRDGDGNDIGDPTGFVGGDAFIVLDVSSPCPADWNKDDLHNTNDFLAYLNDYNAVQGGGTPTFNVPDLAPPLGVLNTADFLLFLNIYNEGCN